MRKQIVLPPQSSKTSLQARSAHRKQQKEAGQYLSGDRASWSILTDAQVPGLRDRYRAGETCRALADEVGVARIALYNALTGRTFAHIPGAVVEVRKRRDHSGEKHFKARLKDADIPDIYTAYWSGVLDTIELASIYGVHNESIRAVVHDKSWKHITRPPVVRLRIRISSRNYKIISINNLTGPIV